MDKLWSFIGKHSSKLIGIPLGLNTAEFLVLLVHSLRDGKLSPTELEQLMQVGDGVSMILLSIVLAYLQFRKKN